MYRSASHYCTRIRDLNIKKSVTHPLVQLFFYLPTIKWYKVTFTIGFSTSIVKWYPVGTVYTFFCLFAGSRFEIKNQMLGMTTRQKLPQIASKNRQGLNLIRTKFNPY
eukprot:SAG11_NODE_1653_length_4508_cov_6.277387_2_plen_108_part_00